MEVRPKRMRLALAAGLVLACVASQAQTWPTKPIRMLVGFPAGGP
jgi:tripartite-type tricarboxylate transporter receptor subunit TctC